MSIIRPPVVVMPGALATHGPTPPLGAAYVAAALRDAGFGVQLIDAAGEAIGHSVEVDSPVGPLQRIGLPLEAIADRIDPQASVVGISTMFLHEWPTVRELSAVIKQRRPDVHLVVGGENATAFHPWMLQQSDAIDCCVLGEGEATMVELVERLTAGRPLAGLTGIAMRPTDESGTEGVGLSEAHDQRSSPNRPLGRPGSSSPSTGTGSTTRSSACTVGGPSRCSGPVAAPTAARSSRHPRCGPRST